uniref:Uncharacterized protein n=1 Tax=Moniliophthora roreri TaxID=221103 RepID=A0A0W0G272_MONRR
MFCNNSQEDKYYTDARQLPSYSS